MMQTELQFTDAEKQRQASQVQTILSMLRDRPQLSSELTSVTWRFSSCIHKLRQQGHRIQIEKLESGDSLHTWRGQVERIEVTEEMQSAYYLTDHWIAKRQERLRFDDFKCCHCHRGEKLQVHHWAYELFAEDIGDLATLCERCHLAMHENDAIKIHFPRYVTPEIAIRLS